VLVKFPETGMEGTQSRSWKWHARNAKDGKAKAEGKV
jgi:hypothetical protein